MWRIYIVGKWKRFLLPINIQEWWTRGKETNIATDKEVSTVHNERNKIFVSEALRFK